MVDLTGKTALVTGASAGIGREIARLLARDAGALILVARRRDRLDQLAAELRSMRADVRIVVREVDLLDRAATGAMIDELERDGEKLDVLVNNAGSGDYGLFHERPWEKTERMLELNVVSATFLLRRVLPGMVERGFGAILNVGSSAGMFPGPGMAAYSATKAYLNHLSEGLRGELAGTGVSVTSLCPGPVPTEFQEVAEAGSRRTMPPAFEIDAVRCAEEAVSALRKGQARIIPGVGMRVVVTALEAVPKSLVRPFLARMGHKLRTRV